MCVEHFCVAVKCYGGSHPRTHRLRARRGITGLWTGLDLRPYRLLDSHNPFEYPFAPAKVVDVFVEYYGPINRAYASLNSDGRQALQDDLTALWVQNNTASDGMTKVPAEYIVAEGTRA